MLAGRDPNTIRRLVTAWVVGCPNRSESALNERLILIFVYDLKEALPLAAAIAKGGPEYLTVSPALRATAALALGRFGSKTDVDALEPLLDDQSLYPVPTQNLPQGLVNSVQVRDVALAMLLHLTDQELKDYGYTRARANPQTVFDPTSLGLDNNEQRFAAIAKWRTWKAEQVAPSTTDR
jgi:HEAT repeat protein